MKGTWLIAFLALVTSGKAQFSQEFACPAIKLINGKVSPVQQSYADKSTVMIQCDDNYDLIGKTNMTCLEDLGGWNALIPMCIQKKVKCPNPGFVNGLMSRMTQSADVQELENVGPQDSIQAGDVIRFECKAGFWMKLMDKLYEEDHIHSVYCRQDGQWDGPLPTCAKIMKEVKCPNPGLRNGFMTRRSRSDDEKEYVQPDDHIHGGDVISFECGEGFVLRVGDIRFGRNLVHIVTCQQSGQWDGPIPVCEKAFECSSLIVLNGKVSPAQHSYADKSTVTIECDPGHYLIGTNNTTCREEQGGWDAPTPKCAKEKVTCINPGLEDGYMARVTRSKAGEQMEAVQPNDPIYGSDTIRFRCRPGFRLRVRDILHEEGYVHTLSCTQDGQWDGVFPTCEKVSVTCAHPNFTGGHMAKEVSQGGAKFLEMVKGSKAITPGDVVQFQCNFGYMIRTEEDVHTDEHIHRLTCLPTGTWSGPFPVCQRFECGPPPIGPGLETFGEADPHFYHADQVRYRCSSEEDELLGPHVLTCRMDYMSWFPHRPTCRAKVCPSVRWPDQGFLVTNSTSLEANCNEGFTLSGSDLRTCLPNGTWSGSTAACQSDDQHCPDPGHPDGGFRSTTGFMVGSELNFRCNNHFLLVGEARQVCTESGKWSAAPVKCLGPNEFSDPAYSVHRWTQIVAAIEEDNSKGGDHQVFLLLDSSGSISNSELNAQRNFFGNLAHKLPRTKISMVSFNNTALLVANQTNSAGIGNALRSHTFSSGGATEIKRALRFVRINRANKKSVIVILNDAINQGGSLSNVLNRRWRVDADKPAIYVVTLGAFVDRHDLLRAVSHHPEPMDHLFFLKHKGELSALTLGIKKA